MNILQKSMNEVVLRLTSLSDKKFGHSIEIRESDMEIIIQQIAQTRVNNGNNSESIKLVNQFKEITTSTLSLLHFSEIDPNFGSIYLCENPDLFRENVIKLEIIASRTELLRSPAGVKGIENHNFYNQSHTHANKGKGNNINIEDRANKLVIAMVCLVLGLLMAVGGGLTPIGILLAIVFFGISAVLFFMYY